ncbi:hypothetical protein HK096_003262 [Nowakowskiella sp. JEL0078]|nr:hypothetical protein HK096_003262 [Nowakowskiella sp. JEL0078]
MKYPVSSLPIAFVFSVIPFIEKYLEITSKISAWAPESELRSSLNNLLASKSSFSANIEKQQEILQITRVELEKIRKNDYLQGYNLQYFENLIRDESEQITKLKNMNEELKETDLSIEHTEKDLRHIVEANESFEELVSQFFSQAEQIPKQYLQLEESKEDIPKSIKKLKLQIEALDLHLSEFQSTQRN